MVFGRKPKEESRPEEIDAAALRLGEASLRDKLGMYHLWYLERRLKDELARAARKGGIFSLVCWRLRGRPGETIPDELVAQAAEVISGGLRTNDVVAQFDEARFVALV